MKKTAVPVLMHENIHTLTDLLDQACEKFADRVFLRYERNDSIYDVTYRHLGAECHAFASWAAETGRKVGHPIKVGLLGRRRPAAKSAIPSRSVFWEAQAPITSP